MDKKLLKDFAMKSRETLTALVTAKLHAMHATEDIAWVQKGEVYQAVIDGRNITLYPSDKDRYDNLRAAVKAEGIKQITEKAAYTWFNRIVAIRYMELNEMLPQGKHNEWLGIRVLSDSNDEADPEILKISNLRRSDLDLPLDVDALLKLPRDDEKFREVLFAVVKKLGQVMPDVFNGDTTAVNFLLPDNLLGSGGFVNEILKYTKTPPLMEYSAFSPAIWSGRSRMGALDAPRRGYDLFFDRHVDYNREIADRLYLPAQIGWCAAATAGKGRCSATPSDPPPDWAQSSSGQVRATRREPSRPNTGRDGDASRICTYGAVG